MGVIRVGVLGGTFNPIHLGHLHIAQRVQSLFSLSQIYFAIASFPPHKRPEDLIPLAHRYAMLSLAVYGELSFIPSLVELEQEASPFTVDTMSKLAVMIGCERAHLCFIAGGDSLLEVQSWRESEELLARYSFIFVARPGTGTIVPSEHLPESVIPRVRDLTGLTRVQIRRRIAEEPSDESRIYIVDAGAPDISSSRIRSLASSEKAIRRMVPRPVREYIRKQHLYGER